MSNTCIAEFIRAGCDVSVVYVAKKLPRAVALKRERREIARLVAMGRVLANVHYNPNRPKTPNEVTSAILASRKSAG